MADTYTVYTHTHTCIHTHTPKRKNLSQEKSRGMWVHPTGSQVYMSGFQVTSAQVGGHSTSGEKNLLTQCPLQPSRTPATPVFEKSLSPPPCPVVRTGASHTCFDALLRYG